ncbi:MAG: T9SS type A sorting domain-containing protein [Saprospiraceae bacterium]|nr:T9SS type A sorting domain-containing protein [Saprospiraceae bacterium]
MALPKPSEAGKYVLIHIRRDNSSLYKDLLTTEIDMSLDGGLGDVTNKNQVVLQDTFSSFLTAVRHGNGRDWWVMLHKNRSNRSLCYLLDPAGLHAPIVQHLGPIWNYQDWAGQPVFSPDGSRYARANPYNGLSIFDFDRCAGTLSNPLFISLDADSAAACGVAFSPNSRLLYLSTGTKLFQFDMQASDIAASRQLIGVYDGFASPFPATFYQQRLAPDGKIYMAATNSVKVLHVINYPDLPGLNCDFLQHEIQLPANMYVGLPNFPHFRLYDLPGSPCDTLGIDGPTTSAPTPPAPDLLHLQPNPATDEVLVSFHQPMEGRWQLVAPSGQVVRAGLWSVTQTTQRIDISHLSAGVYFFRLVAESGRVVSMRKVVVVR